MCADGVSSLLHSVFYRIYTQIKYHVEWNINRGSLFGYGNSNILKLISKPDSILLEDRRCEKGNKRHDQSGVLLTYAIIDGFHITD